MNTAFNEIFKHVHNKNSEEDLTPIKDMIGDLNKEQSEHISSFINESKLSWDDFYKSGSSMHPYVYYNPPYYYSFLGLDGSMDELFEHEKVGFYKMFEEVDKTLKNKEYSLYFYYVEGPYDLMLFKSLFDKLEGQDKYNVLVDLYVSSEYGHAQITRDMWEEAIAEREHPVTKELPVAGDELVVYRGNASESTDVSEAMSWSLESSVATRFLAYSVGMGSSIYKAKIKRGDVIDYLDQRNEAEIVCFPEDVYHIEEIKQIEPIELYTELESSRIVDEFVYYRNTVLSEIDGFNGGSHDRIHSTRVLLLALTLGHLYGISNTDRAILANAAMYHDSARNNDGIDTIHGEDAVEKIIKNNARLLSITCKGVADEYELDNLSVEEQNIMNYIIKWHCIDDEEAKVNINELENKERITRLFDIFKDADALDRIRIRDLDINYLRTDKAIELVGFAHWLHSSII